MGKKLARKQQVLVIEHKYQGKYVAFNPSKGTKIIASGRNPGAVIQNARNQGVEVPAIVFVPKQNMLYVY